MGTVNIRPSRSPTRSQYGRTAELSRRTGNDAEILGGHQVGIRIDGETLSFFDLPSRELLPDGDGGGVDAGVFNCWDR